MKGVMVAIPSLGRAGHVTTLSHTTLAENEIHLAVQEFEQGQYGAIYPAAKVIPVPTQATLPFTRNMIVGYALGKGYKYLITMDDDITGFYVRTRPTGHKLVKTPAAEIVAELTMALDKGYAQAGLSFRPTNWMNAKPYKADTRACCVYALNLQLLQQHNIHYDEQCQLMEDYDLTAQILMAGLHNVTSYRYCFDTVKMGSNAGGISYRSNDLNLEMIAYFEKKWGSHIVRRIKNKATGMDEPQFRWAAFKGVGL